MSLIFLAVLVAVVTVQVESTMTSSVSAQLSTLPSCAASCISQINGVSSIASADAATLCANADLVWFKACLDVSCKDCSNTESSIVADTIKLLKDFCPSCNAQKSSAVLDNTPACAKPCVQNVITTSVLEKSCILQESITVKLTECTKACSSVSSVEQDQLSILIDQVFVCPPTKDIPTVKPTTPWVAVDKPHPSASGNGVKPSQAGNGPTAPAPPAWSYPAEHGAPTTTCEDSKTVVGQAVVLTTTPPSIVYLPVTPIAPAINLYGSGSVQMSVFRGVVFSALMLL
ncbi:hypothetical protein HDU99_007781 [Rhizoclosmatium hyalinum]|nr:hypothetical protein HDU99_007781 [Rhizoclosmatium hyalinum]